MAFSSVHHCCLQGFVPKMKSLEIVICFFVYSFPNFKVNYFCYSTVVYGNAKIEDLFYDNFKRVTKYIILVEVLWNSQILSACEMIAKFTYSFNVRFASHFCWLNFEKQRRLLRRSSWMGRRSCVRNFYSGRDSVSFNTASFFPNSKCKVTPT